MLSLVADYDTTTSSSSEENLTDTEGEEGSQTKEYSSTTARPSSILLPSANSLLSGGSCKPSGDVFNNPFLEAEKLEIDKLQKHVKMVESENHLQQKNGRKICWNNRRGRCRFGNKCKYAHDSDLVEAKEVDVEQKIVKKQFETPATTKTSLSYETHPTKLDVANESSEKLKTRKRPGLSDGIVPGKRVMKTYHNTKKSTL